MASKKASEAEAPADAATEPSAEPESLGDTTENAPVAKKALPPARLTGNTIWCGMDRVAYRRGENAPDVCPVCGTPARIEAE